MGYANECGEAFRPIVPVIFVILSYVAAISYVLADTVDKGKKGADAPGANSIARAVLGSVDTFVWQMLASVVFPSFIINRLVTLIVTLQATVDLPEALQADWIATVLGLVAIPPSVSPARHADPLILNGLLRKATSRFSTKCVGNRGYSTQDAKPKSVSRTSVSGRRRRRSLARGREGAGADSDSPGRTLTRGKGVVGGSGESFAGRSSDAELAAEDVVVVVDLDALVGVEVEFDLRRRLEAHDLFCGGVARRVAGVTLMCRSAAPAPRGPRTPTGDTHKRPTRRGVRANPARCAYFWRTPPQV